MELSWPVLVKMTPSSSRLGTLASLLSTVRNLHSIRVN
jgi:hypothetical protein